MADLVRKAYPSIETLIDLALEDPAPGLGSGKLNTRLIYKHKEELEGLQLAFKA